MVRRIRKSAVLLSGITAGLVGIRMIQAVTPVVVGTVQLPAPVNAFSTSFNFDNTGALYTWNGLNVQNSAGAIIGHVSTGNESDAGPIAFSQDGTQVLVGNGFGGNNDGGAFAGEIFQLPKAGGNATAPVGNVPFQFDFLPVPTSVSTTTGTASKYFVDEGTDSSGNSSSVSIFDPSTGLDKNLIINIGGASASLAIGPANNRLYAEVGFFTSNQPQGQIRSFSLSDVAAAYTNGTTINFSTGTLFSNASTPQSGAGLFFDKDGYLFAGGDGGITVYKPDGTVSYEQTTVGYASIAYNPALDQVLEGPDQFNAPSSTATLYSASSFELVPEPASATLLAIAGTMSLSRRRQAKRIG